MKKRSSSRQQNVGQKPPPLETPISLYQHILANMESICTLLHTKEKNGSECEAIHLKIKAMVVASMTLTFDQLPDQAKATAAFAIDAIDELWNQLSNTADREAYLELVKINAQALQEKLRADDPAQQRKVA